MAQAELPLIGLIRASRELPQYLIDRCHSEADSIALCWHMRTVKFSMRACAASIAMPVSHLSNIIAGKKYLKGEHRISLQLHCGNWAIRQWEDKETGMRTTMESPEQREIRRLESELALLKRTA
jgi:hypothetical protein